MDLFASRARRDIEKLEKLEKKKRRGGQAHSPIDAEPATEAGKVSPDIEMEGMKDFVSAGMTSQQLEKMVDVLEAPISATFTTHSPLPIETEMAVSAGTPEEGSADDVDKDMEEDTNAGDGQQNEDMFFGSKTTEMDFLFHQAEIASQLNSTKVDGASLPTITPPPQEPEATVKAEGCPSASPYTVPSPDDCPPLDTDIPPQNSLSLDTQQAPSPEILAEEKSLPELDAPKAGGATNPAFILPGDTSANKRKAETAPPEADKSLQRVVKPLRSASKGTKGVALSGPLIIQKTQKPPAGEIAENDVVKVFSTHKGSFLMSNVFFTDIGLFLANERHQLYGG